jgi:predicted transcriptional regulator
MRTVTLGISSLEESGKRLDAAFRGKKQGEFISFASPDLLWKVLTAKRWEILQAMIGQGRLTMREIAQLVDRDLKSVHGDVTALIRAGVLNRTKGGTEFPYDALHIDFTLKKAA